jgi:protein gp37
MAETTLISWADKSWSPWTGCTKVSPACDGCYAEFLMDTRIHRAQWGKPGAGAGTRSLMSDAYWRDPIRWNREAEAAGTMYWVFPSLCDPLDNEVPIEWLTRFLQLIEATPNILWLLLTKRPQLAKKRVQAAGYDVLPPNAAIGATCEDVDRASYNLRALCNPGGAVDLKPRFLFVSAEPLLEDISFELSLYVRPATVDEQGRGWVSWVITGGETDQGKHRARPSHPQWFREVRDVCADAGVAFHFKQWGSWVSVSEAEGPGALFTFPDGSSVRKVGKDRAGRTLDGEVHDARP